jgi:putative PIN family toxin of toxin-antitoxin system
VRVVIDTSVLITALRSNAGAAAEVIRMALRSELVTLMDYKLACEYREVTLRPGHMHASGRSIADTEAIVDALEAIAEPVFVAFRHRPLSPDEDDNLVLDVAINGIADAILTNNIKDFKGPAKQFDIEVMTPVALLNNTRRRE